MIPVAASTASREYLASMKLREELINSETRAANPEEFEERLAEIGETLTTLRRMHDNSLITEARNIDAARENL